MGFYGTGPFDNDFAADWIADNASRQTMDEWVGELWGEVKSPERMGADAAAYVIATAALALAAVGAAAYEIPEGVAIPRAIASTANWDRLLTLLVAVPQSELAALFRASPSNAEWSSAVTALTLSVRQASGLG